MGIRQKSLLASILLASLCVPLLGRAEILHLELGAANYGPVSKNSPDRFKVLDETLADLVAMEGSSGTIYLNDIDGKGLRLAVKHVKEWLQSKGLKNVRVEALPGDYTTLKLPHVRSMHLSNPGIGQIPTRTKSMEENSILVSDLERLAEHSDTGLRISSYFHYPNFNESKAPPDMGVLMGMVKDSMLLATGDAGYDYHPSSEVVLPSGGTLPRATKTFILVSKKTHCLNFVLKSMLGSVH